MGDTSIDHGSSLRKNPNATFRALAAGGGGVLLHLESGEYHGLNEIGCKIWELIDGERTTADVIEAIRAEVDNPPPALDDDVTGFIDAMRERDLILASA
jgi:Coenzyme PQQ synthesis protein D (PqqD)